MRAAPTHVYVDPRADEGRRYRVLVVDDEPEIVSYLTRLIESRIPRADVLSTSTPEVALQKVSAGGIDVLLTDLRMPGMDGLALAKSAHHASPGLRTVLMTAFADLEVALRAVNECHVTKIFTKPLDAAALLATLQEELDGVRRKEVQGAAFQHAMDLVKR